MIRHIKHFYGTSITGSGVDGLKDVFDNLNIYHGEYLNLVLRKFSGYLLRINNH